MNWLTPLGFAVPIAVVAAAVVTAGFMRSPAVPQWYPTIDEEHYRELAHDADAFRKMTVQFPQMPLAARPIVQAPPPMVQAAPQADAKTAIARWWCQRANSHCAALRWQHRGTGARTVSRGRGSTFPDTGDDAARLMRNELDAMR